MAIRYNSRIILLVIFREIKKIILRISIETGNYLKKSYINHRTLRTTKKLFSLLPPKVNLFDVIRGPTGQWRTKGLRDALVDT